MPLVHMLGPFQFHGFFGTPDLAEAKIAAEVRAGRNGHDLWNLGVWGEPFELETILGVVNYQAALAAVQAYEAATAMDPLLLMIGSVPISGGNFKVLTVSTMAQACVKFKAAGDPFTYQGVVRAKWTLLGIAFDV